MINVGTKHTTEHYKMYKSGKHWVTAMLATATLTTVAVTTNQISAHADSTGNSISESAETTSGGNAVTKTSANANNSSNSVSYDGTNSQSTSNGGQNNAIPVNVDHSALDQAIQNAKDANVEITSSNTSNQTVDQSQINKAKEDIANDYNKQVNKINDAIQQQKKAEENSNNYNGATSDHSALDEAVKNAQSIPGLNVVKDNNNVTEIDATDSDAIKDWENSTNSDYQNQVTAINNAIATQKQNWENYQKQLASYKDHLNTATTLDPKQLVQNLVLTGKDPSVVGSVTYLQEPAERKKDAISEGGFYTQDMNGEFLKVDFTNFAKSYYIDAKGQKHNIGKITVVYSDLKLMNNIMQHNNARADFSVDTKYKDGNSPWNATNMHYVSSYTQQWFLYDENGALLDLENGTAWLPINSLTRWHSGANWNKGNTGLPDDHIEEIKALSNAKLYTTPKGYATMHSDGYVYADNITSGPDKGVPNTWNAEGGACIASLSNGAKFNWRVAQYPGADFNGTWNYNESNTDLLTGITVTPPTSTVNYHYDVASVLPPQHGKITANYELHNLNVTTNPTKNWTENGQNSNNKVYFDGDTAHATVSATLNSINYYDGIKDGFSISDDYSQLAKDATVTGATVTENGQDVTDQYNLSVHNGVVTMTRKNTDNMQDGTYVLNVTFKLNDDVAKGTQLTNQGFLTVGSHQLDVTPVTITTTTPDPHKDVAAGEINGTSENSINGQTVANGTVSTFPFTTNDLDAHRAKNITDRAYEDTLDSHLTYKGFKAYIKNAQGQLEDVTSHIHATQNGQTITFTEDSYLIARYNKDLTQAVTTPIIDVYAQVNGDNVQIKNQYTLIQNGIKYTSNEVGIHTPEAPKPIKKDYNEDNVDIDGKTVLPGSTNKYEITADYDQYKGIQTSEDNIGKGFYIIDDYPEEALDADPSKFSAIDSTGKSVNDLNYKVYQSVSDAPQDVQEAIQQQGIKVNGAFIVASATNPSEYFTKYVQTGDSITVIMPMTVKDAYTGTYTNSAYEFDFGHGYATNIVTNNVPKITPTKDAVDEAGNPIKDNGNVPLNEVFKYDLHGAVLPGGEGHDLTQYGFTDDYDESHDEYQNTYQVVLTTDVTLKDGTVLKKGTDVTQYTTQSYDLSKGALDVEFSPYFLKTVDMSKATGFGADALPVFKRIASGEVTNQYTNWINGKPYLSNVFKTHTPKPDTPKPSPEPEKPSPKANTPAPVIAAVTPAHPKEQTAKQTKDLPQTGNSKSGLASLGFVGLLMALGSLGIGRKRKSA